MKVFREYKSCFVIALVALFLGYATQPTFSNNSSSNSIPKQSVLKQHPFLIVASSLPTVKVDRPSYSSLSIIKNFNLDKFHQVFSSKLVCLFTFRYIL